MARQARRPWRRAAWGAAGALSSALLIWGFLGCGGDGGTAPPPGNENVIGPTGGTATSADGRAAVTIPAGALAQDVAVTVAPAASPPAGALAGTAYELGPETIVLALPASLRLDYDPAALPGGVAETALRLGKLYGTAWLGVAGSAVDTLANRVTGSLAGFSTYGVLPPAGDGEVDSLTVTVVDSPPQGSVEQFPTLAAALAWLGTQLGEEDLGIVILQTNATQTLASLALPFDVRLRLAPGYDPAIAGPGAAPLVVDAAGAFDLSGLRVVNAGGLVINANRRLVLAGCNLPATEVAIGGVKSARFPAGEPGFTAKRGAGKRAAGADIEGNTFGGDLTYKLQADVITSASYAIADNHGAGVNVGGIGTLRAQAGLELLDNAFGFIDASLKMDANASLSVMNHAALSQLSLAGEAVGGNPTVTLNGNVSADMQLSLKGLGKMTINARANNITSGHVDLSVKDYEFLGINQTYVNLAILVGSAIANPDILWNEAGSVFDGLTFDAVNTPSGKVTFGLERVRFNGDVAFNSKAELKVQLTDDVTFNAAAEIRVDSNLLDLQQTRVTYAGTAKFVAQGASAAVSISSTGGAFSANTQIVAPPTVGLTITLDGSAFDKGGIFYIGSTEKSEQEMAALAAAGPPGWRVGRDAAASWPAMTAALSATAATAPAGDPARAIARTTGGASARAASWRAARRESSIHLDDVTFDRPGGAHIAIENFNCPITVENCRLTTEEATAVLVMNGTQGDVVVRHNEFAGGGVGVFTTQGQITVENNTFVVSGGGHGAVTIPGPGTATISKNTITASGGAAGVSLGNPGQVITVTGNTILAEDAAVSLVLGRANVDDNDAISGVVGVWFGLMHLSGNTLAGARIVDGTPTGGLLNNPSENDGFNAEDCFTFIDWDGNGCCDYPPDNNVPNDEGECPCPGVSPPAGR